MDSFQDSTSTMFASTPVKIAYFHAELDLGEITSLFRL